MYYPFAVCAVVFILFLFFGYQRFNSLEKRIIQVEIQRTLQPNINEMKAKVFLNTEINKRLVEINELKRLKYYISNLNLSSYFIDRCLERVNSEISIQEYIYFRELGEETYKKIQEQDG